MVFSCLQKRISRIPVFPVGNQTVVTGIFTARIPKEWGRYCFHRCVSVHIMGCGVRGGYSCPANGGEGVTPTQLRGHTPIWPMRGVYPHLVNGGYAHPADWGWYPIRLTGGTPCQDWMGVPLIRTGWTTPSPLGLDGVTPHPHWDRRTFS